MRGPGNAFHLMMIGVCRSIAGLCLPGGLLEERNGTRWFSREFRTNRIRRIA
jgi:hypothetical protein